MSTSYASCSNNPYARKYFTKGRRSSEKTGYLDSRPYPMSPKTKKCKQDMEVNCQQNSMNSDSFNFLNDVNELNNDLCDFYENNEEFDRVFPNDFNYNEHQNIADENVEFIGEDIEEFSIDFIDETENSMIENVYNSQYQEPTHYNDTFVNSRLVVPSSRSKRKQGIVGRPTLSSPQQLLIADNVYSYVANDKDNYFTDNNHRVRNTRAIIKKQPDSDDSRTIGSRARPRILLKPSMADYRFTNTETQFTSLYNAQEQDINDVAQRQVANRDFARQLVARAERQGTVIDKNKIPMSVFEQEPVYRSAYVDHHHRISGMVEIKETNQQAYDTISISDPRKSTQSPAAVVVKKPDPPPQLPPPTMTASDLLKQKWKAANRRQS